VSVGYFQEEGEADDETPSQGELQEEKGRQTN